MDVMRRWVWPSLKFLVAAAVAVALVRLAFFAAAPEAPDAAPTGKVADPTVTVSTADVVNDVEATGSVRSVASSPVRSTAEGTVNKVFVANGTHVEQGAPIIDLRVETPAEVTPAAETPAADGGPAAEAALPPRPTVTFATVVAPASGTVSGLDLVAKQPVAVGDVVARVAPEAFRASATLDAAQLYRLTTRPTQATVTIVDGPAPFTCTNLSLSSAVAADGAPVGASSEPSDTDSGSGAVSGTRLECDVPAGVTVFPGLEVRIAVSAGRAEGVLTLPTTAVSGTAESGLVTAIEKDGARSERKVVLGLNDGQTVEIRSGLAEGDEVLEFVPGKDAADDAEGDGSDGGGTEVLG